MSPLDDELRSLLTDRADRLPAAANPLPGIERRARRMRRSRLVASAGGAALALAAVAVAVPSLLPHRESGGQVTYADSPPPAATEAPTPSIPTPVQMSPQEWPPRGTATPAALAFAAQQYAKIAGQPQDRVQLRLLWGGSPDGGPQVLLAAGSVVGATPAATELVVVYFAPDGVQQLIEHDPLPQDAREVDRIVNTGSNPYVVALGEPGTTQIAYAAGGGDDFRAQPLTDGVSAFRRLGPTGSRPDTLLYTFADGTQQTVRVHTGAAEGGSPTAALTLDPSSPWAYRGDSAILTNGLLATMRRDWEAKHPGPTLTPLFGQVYEPSRRPEVTFVAGDRWGVATTSESGTDFVWDQPLPTGPTVLMAPLAGDEGGRLLIVTSPAVGQISYAGDGASFHAILGPVPGVGFAALATDPSHDAVQVLDGDGNLDHPVFQGPAPDPQQRVGSSQPANLLDWLPRGSTPQPSLVDQAVRAFAKGLGASSAVTRSTVLYAGTDRAGRDYVFLQAWLPGQAAHTAGFLRDGKGGGEPFVGPPIGKEPALLAFVVTSPQMTPGQPETLVLLPKPGAGRVRYAPSATAPFTDVANGRSDLNPVALVDRDPRATDDRVEVRAGDDSLLLRGPVTRLLCGISGCG